MLAFVSILPHENYRAMKTIRNPEEIGVLCKELREQKGMTLQDVADAIGEKSRQSISNAERSKNTNRLGLQRRILNYFSIEIQEVFELTEAVSKNA